MGLALECENGVKEDLRFVIPKYVKMTRVKGHLSGEEVIQDTTCQAGVYWWIPILSCCAQLHYAKFRFLWACLVLSPFSLSLRKHQPFIVLSSVSLHHMYVHFIC